MAAISRRELLAGAVAAGAATLTPAFLREALAAPAVPGDGPYGPLGPPNAIGMQLPAGFTGREIARGGSLVAGYPWHYASDGQATFATRDGGHILVSNSETPGVLGGGSSAIRFTPDGAIESAYRILAGTNVNCAGGPTPWGTWLSCEEHQAGMVWEADPAGLLPQQPRPALGNFAHEAAAVDPADGCVYLTEDEDDGCFYRFRPDRPPSLLSGRLEVAAVAPDGAVTWHRVPDPNLLLSLRPTRQQVAAATHFDGGEGLWYDGGTIYFTTKGDKKVWAYDTAARRLEIVFDRAASPDTSLDAVDNITVSATGDVYVCEDGGNMEIGIITPERVVAPFVRMTGPQHEGSEMVGVVFDPSQRRMYFGSQRAHPVLDGTPAALGAIYEVTGPFRLPAGGVPKSKVFGPPAGERPRGEELLPSAASLPGLRISSKDGLRVRVRVAGTAEVRAVLRTSERETVVASRWREPRPVVTPLARLGARLERGTHDLRLRRSARVAGDERRVLLVEARTGRGARRVAALALRDR